MFVRFIGGGATLNDGRSRRSRCDQEGKAARPRSVGFCNRQFSDNMTWFAAGSPCATIGRYAVQVMVAAFVFLSASVCESSGAPVSPSSTPESLYQLSLERIQSNHPQGALDALFALVKNHRTSPLAPDALWKIGEIWQAKQQLPYAAWAWQTLLSRYPHSPHADAALQSYRTWLANRNADANESDACVECVNLLHPDYVSVLDIYLKCKSNPAAYGTLGAWRQTRLQFREHLSAIPEYKLPPFDYWDPLTNVPGKDYYDPEVQGWWVIGRGEEARRRSVVEQRQQGPTLYIASLSAVLPHILRQQGNKAVRDLLLEEAADVRMFDHYDRVRTFCLKQLETVNAAIIAEYRRQGEEHFRNGRHEDARRVYCTLMTEYRGTDAAKFAVSKLFEIANFLATKHKKEGDIHFHWAMRDYSQALAAYQKANAEMGDIGSLWSSLNLQQQQKAQGLKAYLGVRIGECLRNLGRESEAVQQLQEVMQTMQQEKTPESQEMLAEAQYHLALTLGGNLPSQTKTKEQRL